MDSYVVRLLALSGREYCRTVTVVAILLGLYSWKVMSRKRVTNKKLILKDSHIQTPSPDPPMIGVGNTGRLLR